ncbi:Partner of Y14 and mago [Trichoplax sp. H2]|uniref:WIBG Mago-binding domain-containing protein n=2 Tax=Trichoplax adhaerens TaxID=10228 RepID=B3RQS8_TRIAD|nr:hypothetical protein TRIADDRAFT_22941 [Trichoplax adhaerens]EDV27291.1 hypothetical protein TRIADDRAFT_22941 [Trichoplax adhaerens]RDD38756.1 Partner of Y14 and mago [Trichoplax sp. H2]|eukprot:XP_002111287.1 hypothetical protein TRIADDRAFT_22941 [Trichoplax adhaerens]
MATSNEKSAYSIPATKRPDGTWRKERKVKEGYVPQDEMATYESIGKKIVKNQSSSMPPGLVVDTTESSKAKSKAQKKNEQRKLKKQLKNQPSPASHDNVQNAADKLEKCTIGNQPTSTDEWNKPTPDHSQLSDSRKRNIQKKLRQIRELQEKLDSGEIKELNAEQAAKVSKKAQLQKELAGL